MSAALLKNQYELLQGSRRVLLNYCGLIAPEGFTRQIEGFGRGSIRNLLCHNADVYIHWLQNIALNKNIPYINAADIQDIPAIQLIFRQTDLYVDEFIGAFANKLNEALTFTIPNTNRQLTLTPLTFFTHTLTHEFHHKGQILSMSRQLGYTPVDTDMIRS